MSQAPENPAPEAESAPRAVAIDDQRDERDPMGEDAITLSAHVAGSAALDRLVETARDYATAATAENTNKAYAADWAHFARWCRLKGVEPLPPASEMIGLYLTDLAAPSSGAPSRSAHRPLSVSSIERRLSGLAWHFAQRGFALDRKDRHIAKVLAGIRRGLRDRAILFLGFAGGLRRSEIVSLDHGKDDTPNTVGLTKIQLAR